MKLKVTVQGVAYEVEVEVLDPGDGFSSSGPPAPVPRGIPPTTAPAGPVASPAGGLVNSPVAGTIIEIRCTAGSTVVAGEILLVIEAMKMNTHIAAPTAGRVKAVVVAAGDSVREGQVLVELD